MQLDRHFDTDAENCMSLLDRYALELPAWPRADALRVSLPDRVA